MNRKILYTIFGLTLFGIYFIATSSQQEAFSTTGDMWFYLKKQILWTTLGTLSLLVITKIKTKIYQRYALYFYLFSIISLILVLLPSFGNSAFGAQRWISFFGFNLQPLEFAKITTIIYFAKIFSNHKNINIIHIFISLFPPIFLLMLQPNMSGASLLLGIVLFMYYLSGQSIKQLLFFILACLLFGSIFIAISPYRKQRFLSLTTTSSYHTKQIQLGINTGGIFGSGLGNSQQKYKFIPQLSKDSIGATIAEETGLLGLGMLSIAYLYLTSLILQKSTHQAEFDALLSAGVAIWISLQAIINLASLTGLIPLTGVTLPFVSYGGSSILSLYIAIGIVCNRG